MIPRSEETVGRLLRRRSATLATAESCTGGLLGGRITSVPGSSAWYLGGLIAYSNAVKVRHLGVGSGLLTTHGAVSEPVARQMARGVRRRFGSDYGIGITGVAGPTGGTADKPVGLVWIAVAGPGGCVAAARRFRGGREAVRRRAAQLALAMLKDALTAGSPGA